LQAWNLTDLAVLKLHITLTSSVSVGLCAPGSGAGGALITKLQPWKMTLPSLTGTDEPLVRERER